MEGCEWKTSREVGTEMGFEKWVARNTHKDSDVRKQWIREREIIQ